MSGLRALMCALTRGERGELHVFSRHKLFATAAAGRYRLLAGRGS